MRYINILTQPESKFLKLYFNPIEGETVLDFKGNISLGVTSKKNYLLRIGTSSFYLPTDVVATDLNKIDNVIVLGFGFGIGFEPE